MTIEAKLLVVCVGMLTFVCWNIVAEKIAKARAYAAMRKIILDGSFRIDNGKDGQ